MLFNSFPFIFAFLPITLLGYELLRRRGLQRAKKIWLIAASCVFYAYWSAAFLGAAVRLDRRQLFRRTSPAVDRARARHARRARLLIIGLIWNLSLLGYFKYANFFIDNFDAAFGLHIELARIVLPLGISFFTFQKVAFLVDSYRNKVEPPHVHRLCLFVMFFPQLIAGPIVHFGEVIPQFSRPNDAAGHERYAIGITVFAIGLAKKVLVADTFAIHAGAFFDAAARRVRTRHARGMDRHALLHAADLLRFFGLLRHGDRPCLDVRRPAADQLRVAVQGAIDRRILAALARHAVAVPAATTSTSRSAAIAAARRVRTST